MTFKKFIGKIHLWLGLSSGLVVLILGITGCILAFELEIRSFTEPFRNVKVENRDVLPPSELKGIAEKHLASKKALGIEYPGKDKAAVAAYYDEKKYELVFMNPYSGEVLKHKNMNRDFFRVVLDGHYYLWLPENIGQPIAASATLVFLVMMISGLILWWPKNKAAKKQRFTIKWSARWRRKNYDLHNVLGFYMTWVAIFLAVTGLVFGFQWFARSVYWITSGGETMVEHTHPVSDTTKKASFANMADHLWQEHRTGLKDGESIGVYFAAIPTDPVEIAVNHKPGTYYHSDYYHYDQYTGKELPATGSYAGSFEDAPLADKIVRMNYDMHVGAILGLPGKILAFFASLIAASLPVTGFYIWWGRKKKKKAVFVKQAKLVAAVA
ncbi:MAG TPA: PepSY-associated TM helix domain-containing protein [Agriterribacter sp.]|nr:PepSY-associated TM helix domain-containing protein [Agriterribacter sp.]